MSNPTLFAGILSISIALSVSAPVAAQSAWPDAAPISTFLPGDGVETIVDAEAGCEEGIVFLIHNPVDTTARAVMYDPTTWEQVWDVPFTASGPVIPGGVEYDATSNQLIFALSVKGTLDSLVTKHASNDDFDSYEVMFIGKDCKVGTYESVFGEADGDQFATDLAISDGNIFISGTDRSGGAETGTIWRTKSGDLALESFFVEPRGIVTDVEHVLDPVDGQPAILSFSSIPDVGGGLGTDIQIRLHALSNNSIREQIIEGEGNQFVQSIAPGGDGLAMLAVGTTGPIKADDWDMTGSFHPGEHGFDGAYIALNLADLSVDRAAYIESDESEVPLAAAAFQGYFMMESHLRGNLEGVVLSARDRSTSDIVWQREIGHVRPEGILALGENMAIFGSGFPGAETTPNAIVDEIDSGSRPFIHVAPTEVSTVLVVNDCLDDTSGNSQDVCTVSNSSGILVSVSYGDSTTISFPDVVKTPKPGGPIPIPYPNIGRSADNTAAHVKVKTSDVDSMNIKIKETRYSKTDVIVVTGPKKSSKFSFTRFSSDVKFEGKNVVRISDPFAHNEKNVTSGATVDEIKSGQCVVCVEPIQPDSMVIVGAGGVLEVSDANAPEDRVVYNLDELLQVSLMNRFGWTSAIGLTTRPPSGKTSAVPTLKFYDLAGTLIEPRIVTSAESELQSGVPQRFELHANYPNPFNPSTSISYSLPERTSVSVTVHDLIGREVRQLVDEFQSAGDYSVTFDAGGIPSGIYFYSIRAGGSVKTRSMVLMK